MSKKIKDTGSSKRAEIVVSNLKPAAPDEFAELKVKFVAFVKDVYGDSAVVEQEDVRLFIKIDGEVKHLFTL